MPYLSAVPINPARPYARSLLKSPNVVHDALMHGFPSDPYDERTLWRWEARERGYRPRLLVLTKNKPDWSHIVERAGWSTIPAGEPVIKDYQPVLDGVRTGRAYEFRIDASPILNACGPRNGPKTRRRPTLNEREDRAWLLRVANTNGFEIPLTTPEPSIIGLDQNAKQTHAFTAEHTQNVSCYLDDGKRGKKRVTIVRASFRGVLLVTDPHLFRQALTGGIGREKAYGCGLLTLSPPRVTYAPASS
jgi:CRISPR system Cascade subunit CasE